MRSLLRNSSLACLLCTCLSTACNEHATTVYHSYQPLSSEDWSKSDTLSFDILISDSIPATLEVFTEVRNRTEYPYQELRLLVSQNLQDSTTWHTDSVTVRLADSTGRWSGNGWGSIYQSGAFVTSVRPPHRGHYTIKVVSGMKDEKLPGLNDIGIRVEKR